MRNTFILKVATISLIFFPFVSSAQVASNKKDLGYVINIIIGYLNQILVLLIGLAVVIFVWYVIQYFIKPNEDRKNAAPYVMYSLIGFFVMLSFWGLVNILQNTFGLKNEQNAPASWTSFQNIFPGGGSSYNNSSAGSSGGSQTVVDFDPYGQEYNPGSSGGVQTGVGSSGGVQTGSSGVRSASFDPYGQEYNPNNVDTSSADAYGQEYNPANVSAPTP